MDHQSKSQEIRSYLNGQTLRIGECDTGELDNHVKKDSKGWTLITTDGFSIGWAKAAGGMLKNHYPKGLRINY